MAEPKTKKNSASVTAFVNSVENPQRRADAKELLRIFKEATGLTPAMWGTSIVGYGMYHYKSERSSQEGDWPRAAFSPRKQNMTVYLGPSFKGRGELLKKIGKHKKSLACLYFNRLSDIHVPTLKLLIKESLKEMKRRYPEGA